MDRRHKILLNVVLVVLIFAPLFYVLRHQAWLPLYWDALSLFIIIYMCWSFFRLAINVPSQRTSRGKRCWSASGAWRWLCCSLPITGWSCFAAIGGSVVVALIVGRDET